MRSETWVPPTVVPEGQRVNPCDFFFFPMKLKEHLIQGGFGTDPSSSAGFSAALRCENFSSVNLINSRMLA